MPKPLELYEELKAKLGEKEAKDLVEFVQESVERGAASKEDVRNSEVALREEMHQMEAGLREDMHQMEAGLREDMRKMEASLREDMRQLQAEFHKEISSLQRWLFGFWVTIIVAILFKEFLR